MDHAIARVVMAELCLDESFSKINEVMGEAGV
jgi:hypothetical protein